MLDVNLKISLLRLKKLEFSGLSRLVVLMLPIFVHLGAWAQVESPQTFTLDGKFYQSGTSNPLVDSSINVRIQILNHDKTCLLYEESQVVDTSTTAGNFSIQVGSEVGAGKRTANDPGLAMSNIVQNGSLVTTGKLLTNLTVPCNNAATLPTLARSVRHIRVYVDPTAGAEEVLSPDMRLEAVPSALVAETVQGLGKSSLLQVSVADNLSQNNLQSIFTGTNFTKLTDLINGSSAQYVLPSGSNFVPTAAISFNAQRITNVATPSAGTDATNKTYVDGQIGGRTVSATIATIGAGDAGKVLQWDGAQWVAATASDSTKLPLAGGTMAGDITMGGNDIFNAGHITMNPNFYLQLSSRAADPAGLTAGHEGVMWYDSVADVIKYWDGDSVETVGGSFTVAGSTLTNGRIWVGNGSGQAAEVPVSGDAALANTGALTIANDAITNAKMADNAVNTNELANGAVTTAKIADANITPAKLAASSAAGRLPIVNGTNTAFDWMSCAADQTLNWDAVLGFVCETNYTFGTGDLLVARQNAGAGGGAQIRLQSNSGTNSVILKAPDGLASDLTFRFPSNAGSNGNVLTTDGAGGLSWSAASSGGVSTVDTFDTTSTANGLSISGSNIKLHAADGTNPGAVSTGTQTFAGAKTFSGAATFSAAGTGVSITNNATVGGNLTVDTNTLFVDAASNRVGIGTNIPTNKLDIRGNSTSNSNLYLTNATLVVDPTVDQDAGRVNSGQSISVEGGTSTNKAIGKLFGQNIYVGYDWGNNTASDLIGSQISVQKNTGGSVANLKGLTLDIGSYSGGSISNLTVQEIYSEAMAGTVTNQHGILISDLAQTGATTTNRYGLRINSFSGSVSGDDFAIYQAGSNQRNYFAGKVGIGTLSPASSSILDLTSTSTGLLIPRMTTAQRNAITSPATGLFIYNTDSNAFNYYNGTAWTPMAASGSYGAMTGVTSITGTAAMTVQSGATGDLTLSSQAVGSNVILQAGTGAGVVQANSPFYVNNSTASTSSSTGALIVNGGVGVGGTLNVGGNIVATGRVVGSAGTDADALTSITVDFASTNMIRATGASADCGTLNFTNVAAGGNYTVTIPNATKTCTTIHLNGATTNVKLPAGYGAGGATVAGVVYTAIFDGTTLWVSFVGF